MSSNAIRSSKKPVRWPENFNIKDFATGYIRLQNDQGRNAGQTA